MSPISSGMSAETSGADRSNGCCGTIAAVDHRAERIAVEQRLRRGADRLLRGFHRRQKLRHRQRLQLAKVVAGEAEHLQHGIGQLGCAVALAQPDRRAALHDGAMEQPARRRHRQQRADLAAAAELAEDRDVARIAAEAVDVVAHPFQCGDHVQRAGIAGRGEIRAADRRQVEEAEDVQPLVHGDDDHVATLGQPRALQPGDVRGAVGERAAMEPHHDRPLRRCRSPGDQTLRVRQSSVSGEVSGGPEKSASSGRVAGAQTLLRRMSGVVQRVAHAGPGRRPARRHEAVGARCRRTIGNALEGGDTVDDRAADLAGRGLDRRRALEVPISFIASSRFRAPACSGGAQAVDTGAALDPRRGGGLRSLQSIRKPQCGSGGS